MADLFALLTARARGEAPLLRLRPRGLFEQGGALRGDAPLPVAAPHAAATPEPLPAMARGTAPPVLHRRTTPTLPAAILPASAMAPPPPPSPPPLSPHGLAPPPRPIPPPLPVVAQAADAPNHAVPDATAHAVPRRADALPGAAAQTPGPAPAPAAARAPDHAQLPAATPAPPAIIMAAPAPTEPAFPPHAAPPMRARRAGVLPPDARPGITPDIRVEIGRIELRAAAPPPAPAPPRQSLLMPLDRYLKRGPRA